MKPTETVFAPGEPERVLAADPAVFVSYGGGKVMEALPAHNVTITMEPEQAIQRAAALVRAAARARGEG